MDFLTCVFDTGKSYSTVNTYKSAICCTIKCVSGRDLGTNHLVCRFMKGLYTMKPPLPRYSHTWDVNVVTKFLRTLMPLDSISLKDLSCKLVTLIALTSAQRSQTLHALNLNHMCIEKERITFVIVEKLKTSRPGNSSIKVVVPKVADKAVCPVTHLLAYLERTAELRKCHNVSELFISYCKPHKSVSCSTLARWIKWILGQSGIDVCKFKAHSTRSAATSKAFFSGASIQDILKLANWSNDKIFVKFYKRNVPSDETSVGEVILL